MDNLSKKCNYLALLFFLLFEITIAQTLNFQINPTSDFDSLQFSPSGVIIQQLSPFDFKIKRENFCITIKSNEEKIRKCFSPASTDHFLFYSPQFENQKLNTVEIIEKKKKREAQKLSISDKIDPINIGGENDPIITSTILPGIQSAGEFQQGIYVRGQVPIKTYSYWMVLQYMLLFISLEYSRFLTTI